MNYKTINRLKVRSFWFLGLAFFIALLSACVGDSILSDEDRLSSNEAYAELLLRSSGTENSQKKAEYDSDINSLTVLVFKHDTNESPVFAYKAPVSAIKKQENGEFLVSTKLKVSQTENDQYSLALIANVDISDADLSAYKGFPKETLIKKLNFQSTHLDKDKEDYFWKDKYLPMYGESDPKHISKVPQVWGTIYMIRSVAKVTIDIQSNDQNLVFGELYIHNAVSKGRYASDVHSSFLEGNNTPSNTKVTLPDFNTNETQYTNWVKFVDFATQSATPIILSENEGGSRDDVDKTTCFVLGLKKDKDSKISYYRLDIPKMLESGGFDKEKTEPILRNRHYVVKVTHVEGEGAENPDDALKQEIEIDCTVQIGEWNTIKESYDLAGEYRFELDVREINFDDYSGNEITKTISYDSNVPAEKIYFKNSEKPTSITIDTYKLTINSKLNQLEISCHGVPKKNKNTVILCVENMEIPIDLYGIPEALTFFYPEIDVYTEGYYIESYPIDESNYLDVWLDKAFFGIENDAEIEFNTNSQEECGFEFRKLERISSKNTNGKWVNIQVPAQGKPNKNGKFECYLDFTISYPSVNKNYKLKYKTKFNLYASKKPEFSNLKILFVAYGYKLFPTDESGSEHYGNEGYLDKNGNKIDYNHNIGKLLFNEKLFGLEGTVKIKPFVYYKETQKLDPYLENNIIYQVSSLWDVNDLNEFDVIFYINSFIDNELRNRDLSNKVINYMNNKNHVFIQTPSSKVNRSIFSQYSDPIFNEFFGSKYLGFKLDIERTSRLVRNQRVPEINYSFPKIQEYGVDKKHIVFPSVANTLGKSLYEVYDDFNYINSSYLLDLASKYVITSTSIFLKAKSYTPIIVANENKNYMWIGSSYLFSDYAVNIDKDHLPIKGNHDSYGGLLSMSDKDLWEQVTGNDDTYNSYFFMNIMNWALTRANTK